MCGISGLIGLKNEIERNTVIRKMNDSMAHRGPDADGFYIDDQVALGHRRLSIIDLSSAANQPFTDNTQRYYIVFNGEIYNFQEIKALLPDYPFRTSGDTEVIVAAFAKWGPACLNYFKGMFAFGIWDTQEKELFIARDRFGVKPLYYYDQGDLFLFASEIRSILASNVVNRKLDELALESYLMFQSIITPTTLVRNVKQLPAGYYMCKRAGKTELKKYWNITQNSEPIHEHSYDQIKSKVRELLYKAVERRLVSDVPLGTFLSGGIDSSIVSGIMAETSSYQTNAFTIAFDEKDYDESEYATVIAKKFKLNHSKLLLRASDFLDELPTALEAMDTPSGDGLNTYVVSKAIRNSGIIVAMSGVGGDELFAGYPIFSQFLKLQKFRTTFNHSYLLRKWVTLLITGKNQKLLRLKDLLSAPTSDISDIYPFFREIQTVTGIRNLMNRKNKRSSHHLSAILSEQRAHINRFSYLSQVSIADYLGYTQHVLLKDMDQMSMASSLEVREPFFDHDLIEYVLNIPDKYKMGTLPKNLLVESTYPLLPEEIIKRRKKGFVLPYDHWIRNELSAFCKAKIDNLANRPEFNGKAIQEFWKQYFHKKSNIRWADIWILIVLENWLEKNNIQ